MFYYEEKRMNYEEKSWRENVHGEFWIICKTQVAKIKFFIFLNAITYHEQVGKKSSQNDFS